MRAYARMADDDAMYRTAVRIKARAIRRCGELLKQFQVAPQGGRPKKNDAGDHTVSQAQVARAAGMSEHQERIARNVANLPEDEFERRVESDSPPTVTQLAELGKTSRPEPAEPPKPPGFAQATQFMGQVRELAAFCAANPPQRIGIPHVSGGSRDDGGWGSAPWASLSITTGADAPR